jgi:hypothetical protein
MTERKKDDPSSHDGNEQPKPLHQANHCPVSEGHAASRSWFRWFNVRSSRVWQTTRMKRKLEDFQASLTTKRLKRRDNHSIEEQEKLISIPDRFSALSLDTAAGTTLNEPYQMSSTVSPTETITSTTFPQKQEPQGAPLTIAITDITDNTASFTVQEASSIKLAADALYSVGLWEDAFPLYVMVWKHLLNSKVPRSHRYNVITACARAVVLTEHVTIVRHMLETEIFDLNVTHSEHSNTCRTYESLLHLLLSRCCWMQRDNTASKEHFEMAAHGCSDENDLIRMLMSLKQPRGGKHISSKPAGIQSVDVDQYSRCSLGSRANSMQYTTSIGSPNMDVFIAAVDHSIPKLLVSPVMGEHRVIGSLLAWCGLVSPLGSKPLAEKSWNAPQTISDRKMTMPINLRLFCHLWVQWINRKRIDSCYSWAGGRNSTTFSDFQRVMECPLEPLGTGLEAVSITEFLMVLSSLILQPGNYHGALSDVCPSAMISNFNNLSEMDEIQLLNCFSTRHLSILSRHLPWFRQSTPLLRHTMRQFVEETLNIILPDIPASSKKVRSCVARKPLKSPVVEDQPVPSIESDNLCSRSLQEPERPRGLIKVLSRRVQQKPRARTLTSGHSREVNSSRRNSTRSPFLQPVNEEIVAHGPEMAEIDPALIINLPLAHSLRPSDNLSFRRFASYARSEWSPRRHISSRRSIV